MRRKVDLRTALVAALATALLAGAGTAVAAKLITSADIKDGTIRVKDLDPDAVARLKAARGDRGPVGATGRRGRTGRRGKPGRRGPAGLVKSFAVTTPDGRVANGRGLVVARISTGRYCVAHRRGEGARRPAVIVATAIRGATPGAPTAYRDPAGDAGCPNGGALISVDTPQGTQSLPTDTGLSVLVP